jgi:hypothetical protein
MHDYCPICDIIIIGRYMMDKLIDLTGLNGFRLEAAIKKNLDMLLRINLHDFVLYFKELITVDVSYSPEYSKYAMNYYGDAIKDYDFISKYPDVIFESSYFLINFRKDFTAMMKNVPIGLYQVNKKKFMDLVKSAINRCDKLYYAKDILDYFYQNTGDIYFRQIYELIKSKEPHDLSQHIFALFDDISNLEEVSNNWERYSKVYFTKIINGNDIRKTKEVLCLKIYNCSFESMSKRYYQYIISNRTSELDNMILLFEKIVAAQTKDDLLQIYNDSELLSEEQRKAIQGTFDDIGNQIDIDSKKGLSEVSSYRPPEETKIKTVNGVGVFDISETDFSLIIHNVSAGLGNSEITDAASVDLSIWESLETTGSITISSSEISNSFLGHVTRKQNNRTEVIFAFSDIPPDEILTSGIQDLGFNTGVEDYSKVSKTDGSGQCFLAEQLMTNCFADYNEIIINRFTDKSKVKKRLPNYIVCYDEINELSMRYAEHFHIPILFIDTKKCAYRNAAIIKQKLDNTVDPYSLLNNINGFFSFICGLKHNSVVFEIADKIDWQETMLNAINNVIKHVKSISDMRKLLMIIDYIYENVPKYFQGILKSTNNSNENYSAITDKFVNFQQKIDIVRRNIQAKLKGIPLANNDVIEENNEIRR